MRLAITAIGAAAVLSGCSLLPTRTETVLLAPPAALTQPCSEPQGAPTTNGAMAELLLGYRAALRGCNDQLQGIRLWIDEAAP